ncbi:MAG: hypothetical protein IT462_12390 [Planctomycetes bacterium]|nr:hypothetical protein [Planctomycetota bacterium]
MMRFGLSILLLAAAILAGCNYRMASSLDGGPTRTIFLTTVENQLYPPRAGLEYDLTRRFKDEIAVDRRLRLVDGAADINMRATLIGFDEPTIVKTLDSGLPAEILVRATVVVEAWGDGIAGQPKRIGDVEVENVITRRITVSDTYAPAAGDSRETALERLWRDLAREMIDFVTDYEWARG